MISTKLFIYDPASRTFSAEISNLGPGFRWVQAYPDACDEGFVLVSARTGAERMLVVTETRRDAEGEVTGWELRPVKGRNDFRVVLFND